MGIKFLFKCHNHKEETPSLEVDLIKGKYYCFSCGARGFTSESKQVTQMVISHLEGIIEYLKGNL